MAADPVSVNVCCFSRQRAAALGLFLTRQKGIEVSINIGNSKQVTSNCKRDGYLPVSH